MYEIDPKCDLARAREFIAEPIGLNSPNLQRLLRTMRSGPVKGRYAFLCINPGHEWTLMQVIGECGVPPEMLEDTAFGDLLASERTVFKQSSRQSTCSASPERR